MNKKLTHLDNSEISHSTESLPNHEKIINWLRLYRSSNVGPVTFFQLIKTFGSVEDIISNFDEAIHRSSTNRQISICSREEAEKELEAVQDFGAEIILHCDPRFPNSLKEIYDCPPLICVKGDVELLDRDKIAIVGPRNPSCNAVTIAKKIALMVGQNSFSTVSGMARGIDSVVHHASILSGTIAVLAGGIDNIYPSENLQLYRQIGLCGLLISEMPFGYVPKSSNFVQRNRIVSGLAKAVIVVEASLKSGSLITARFAMDQGREVYAIPGSPFDSRCHGVNLLIKEGAEIIANISDFSVEINAIKSRSQKLPRIMLEDNLPTFQIIDEDSLEKTDFFNHSPELEIEKICKKILAIVNASPTCLEDIISSLKEFPVNLINIALTHLEIIGKIEIRQGKISLLID